MVKTALDVSALQKSTVGHGFGAGSKVSFDLFRLKALMNDFRADAVRPKPETVSRQHVQRDDNSYKPEDVHKQSGITGRNTDVHTQRCHAKYEKVTQAGEEAGKPVTVDSEKDMHDRKAVDNGSRQPGAQEVSVTKKNNQCSGVTGQILANTLELSNVDLAAEFVKMTIMERGFQATSRMVSTSDELMTELVNLKRL